LLSKGTPLGLPNMVIIAIVVAVIVYYFLNYTRTGREIYAVGSNPDAAQFVGIRKNRIIFLVLLAQRNRHWIGCSVMGFAF